MALKPVYLHKHYKLYFIDIGQLVVFSEKLHVFLMKAMPCCGPLIIGAILLHGTTTNIYLIVAFTVMKRQVQRKQWQISFNWMNNYLKDMEELSIDEISSFHFHQYFWKIKISAQRNEIIFRPHWTYAPGSSTAEFVILSFRI